MRTVRTKVYLFNELSKEAQENAILLNQDINVDHDWWVFTYEDAKEVGLKLMGFDLDYKCSADGVFIEDAYFCASQIIKKHGSDCESYSLATGFLAAYDNLETGEEEQDFEEIEQEFLKNILYYYADYLQKECNYLQSSEAVKETLIANDYEFLSNGKIY